MSATAPSRCTSSIHYNGWGDYPNPEGFTNRAQTHGAFEGAFIRRNLRLDAVEAAMPAPNLDGVRSARADGRLSERRRWPRSRPSIGWRRPAASPPMPSAARRGRSPRSAVAAGAAELRDLIILAWRAAGEPVDRLARGQGGRGRGRDGRSVAGHDRRGLSVSDQLRPCDSRIWCISDVTWMARSDDGVASLPKSTHGVKLADRTGSAEH